MPIKTLHITNYYHSASGGISTYYHALLAAANDHERDVRLIVPAARTYTQDVGAYGRIYHIAAPRVPVFDSRYRLLLPHTYAIPHLSVIRRILRDEQPDLIEVCDKYALIPLAGLVRRGLVGEVKRRPALVALSCERMDANIRSYITPSARGERFARFWIGNLYLPLFDYHIANSAYTADELVQAIEGQNENRAQWLFRWIWRFFKTPQMPAAERIRVCSKGVDTDRYTPARRTPVVRQQLLHRTGGDTERTRLLLYAGRLAPEKNIELLVEMMRYLVTDTAYDYRLIVAGDGPLAAWLARQDEQLQIGDKASRVHLLGHISDPQRLADLYANVDAFVHPNPHEPFGLAPLEAMASGVPLVAPNMGGVTTYADHTNAWLAEARGDAFAAAVRAVFSNSHAQSVKLAEARRTAAAHCWSATTNRFFALYDELHQQCTQRFSRHASVGVVPAGALREQPREQPREQHPAELGRRAE